MAARPTMSSEEALSIWDLVSGSLSNSKVGATQAISIRSFEVGSTIRRCSKLLQSVSGENIRFIKTDILHSEGVQQLISIDMKELLTIAVADKWEEFNMLCKEVIRYGDLCEDPQWHNLGRFFKSLLSREFEYKWLKEEPETLMVKMNTLAQHTSELYHQLNAFSRFEQDCRRKNEEVATLQLYRRGDSFIRLQSELKHQRKLLKSLKKKSLWFLSWGKVVGVLVYIVSFIASQIFKGFGYVRCESAASSRSIKQERIIKPEKLGVVGIALHYANIITLINNIASQPTSLSANMRNTLYRWLPTHIKAELRYKLRTFEGKEMLTITQIKDEMEKTLQWLVPLASNTIKAHQGFRPRVKDSFDSNEIVERTKAHYYIMRLQTLYHADKMKTDSCIIELLIWLHYLIQHVIGSASWYTGTTVTQEYAGPKFCSE